MIKFRAWYHKHEAMYSVASIYLELECISVLEDDYVFGLEEVVLMQYTGLKDKYGVEIYEGDIVNVTQYAGGHPFGQLPHVVKVSKYSNALILDALSKQIYAEEYPLYFSRIKDYEVIGNIYESPERLEVSE